MSDDVAAAAAVAASAIASHDTHMYVHTALHTIRIHL